MSVDPMRGELDLDVIEMVNRHNKQVRENERKQQLENTISRYEQSHPVRTTRTTTRRPSGYPDIRRELDRDTFTHGKGKHVKKKKSNPLSKVALTTAIAAICAAGAIKSQAPKQPEPDTTMPPTAIVQPYEYDDTTVIQGEESLKYTSAPVQTPDVLTMTNPSVQEEEKISPEAYQLLDDLSSTGGLAWSEFETLCESFGLSKEETAQKVVYHCNSEEWGNGCISPLMLCAQMYHESYYIKDKVGDGGDAIGLGQFHKVAVDEVNRIYGTDYKYSDREDPNKSIEMMTLYLRYCLKRTGSTEGMLAMYNAGHPDAIEHQYGRNYVNNVLNKINGGN